MSFSPFLLILSLFYSVPSTNVNNFFSHNFLEGHTEDNKCSLCYQEFKSSKALSIHTSHYCLKRPPEVIEATKGSLPVLPDGSATQSEVISSSVVSSSSRDSLNDIDISDSSDEEDPNNPYEIPEHLKRALIRTVRDVEVVLPMIHQEDLVSCMRTPAFRKLQGIL